jgi:hypothetical protein
LNASEFSSESRIPMVASFRSAANAGSGFRRL